ncbi:MAG: DeoR family transcriptional regulator [Candidatus Melainabacteria bacterium]|jgi:Fic family protein|nr:DeoR family transcriptional regulator [Candidatus Melainabacteria bacterium]
MSKRELNQRQKIILEILAKEGSANTASIVAAVEEVASKTIVRDLNLLQDLGLIKKSGQAKATSYSLLPLYKLTNDIDKEEYFQLEPDDREIENKFNLSIFSDLEVSSDNIFTKSELDQIKSLTKTYQANRSELSRATIKKEFERLTIELAWKSSKIEGNTYSLLDTETLLKSGIVSPGHSEEERLMLLNHKHSLNYIFDNPKYYKDLSLNNLTELHSLIVDQLEIGKQIRTRLVGITGTNYQPLDNEFQIKEALLKTCKLINQCSDPMVKSLYASALLAYIQAFEDGNKRTSRIVTNALLIAYDYCPLSYRSIDIGEYKKAVLLFYEQNNIRYLKELLIEQYEFAVDHYFC